MQNTTSLFTFRKNLEDQSVKRNIVQVIRNEYEIIRKRKNTTQETRMQNTTSSLHV